MGRTPAGCPCGALLRAARSDSSLTVEQASEGRRLMYCATASSWVQRLCSLTTQTRESRASAGPFPIPRVQIIGGVCVCVWGDLLAL